jgi:hypothetical protein
MSRIRKFLEGEPLPAMSVFHTIAAKRYVMENGRPINPAFMECRQVGDVIRKAREGAFKEALINPKHPDYEKG